ncbi:DUF6907 domain-containing protein [Georgenia sp. Z1344]|uniref:DUF6907 domain-containing protein n=1 Tax=Georgenia sp. Z1344 TaxID=3416706 RepID=UPI003CEDAED6
MPTTTTRPKVPPIVCQPWCRDGDGHGDESGIDDQRCQTESTNVVSSLTPRWDAGGTWYDTELEVFAISGPRVHPAVVLYSTCGDFEWHLTASEARTIATALRERADALEGRDR